jgi:hypothetical protein
VASCSRCDRVLVALAFVRVHAISVVSYAPGEITIELSFDESFSRLVPCIHCPRCRRCGCCFFLPLPVAQGLGTAMLDFTVKMTGGGTVLATTRNFKIMT